MLVLTKKNSEKSPFLTGKEGRHKPTLAQISTSFEVTKAKEKRIRGWFTKKKSNKSSKIKTVKKNAY